MNVLVFWMDLLNCMQTLEPVHASDWAGMRLMLTSVVTLLVSLGHVWLDVRTRRPLDRCPTFAIWMFSCLLAFCGLFVVLLRWCDGRLFNWGRRVARFG